MDEESPAGEEENKKRERRGGGEIGKVGELTCACEKEERRKAKRQLKARRVMVPYRTEAVMARQRCSSLAVGIASPRCKPCTM